MVITRDRYGSIVWIRPEFPGYVQCRGTEGGAHEEETEGTPGDYSGGHRNDESTRQIPTLSLSAACEYAIFGR